MKASKNFEKVIKAYLDKRANEDELFAVSYAKENKNLNDCITYILNTVKASGCCGFEDYEIYSLAVHYYDEDDIKVGNPIDCKVVVNQHVELTEEEKEEARKQAMRELINSERERLTKKRNKPVKKEEEAVTQGNLF